MADDATFPEDANNNLAKQIGTNFREQLAALIKFYPKVRGMAEGGIPTEPGLCIADGLVVGRTYDAEKMEIGYVLKGTPDVLFGFGEDSSLKAVDTLMQPSAKVEAAMKLADTITLRKGVCKTAYMEFEEWLMYEPDANEVIKGTNFQLNFNEAAVGKDKPFTTMNFVNGVRIPHREMTWQQEEALGLDKNSLRPR